MARTPVPTEFRHVLVHVLSELTTILAIPRIPRRVRARLEALETEIATLLIRHLPR
jgi:hypothetical protein